MSRARLLDTAGFNQLASCRDGYFLYNTNDQYIGRSIEKYGEYAGLEAQLLQRLCAPGDVVVEAGANIGALTVGLARKVGRAGRVLAFEPQRLAFQTLCANVALNSLENVDCYCAALGAREGAITVPELDPRTQNNFGGVSLLGAAQGREVDCFMLDRFISAPAVKLIKIDVQGMEADVLGGGLQLIRKHRPHLYVENDSPETSEALMQLIRSLGYRLYWHLPALFNPDNYYAEAANDFPDIISVNMICIHRDSTAQIAGADEIVDFSLHPMRR